MDELLVALENALDELISERYGDSPEEVQTLIRSKILTEEKRMLGYDN